MTVRGKRKWSACMGLGLALLLFASAPAFAQGTETSLDEAADAAAEETIEAVDTLMEEVAASTESLAAGAGFADLEEPQTFMQRFTQSGAVQFFDNGGPFMWPLLALSVIGLAFFFERLFTFSKARINVRKFLDEIAQALRSGGIDAAKSVCEKTSGPISAVLHAGLMKAGRGPDAIEKAIQSAGTIEMSFLERGLVVISSVATIGPLLGFAGTVSGMISAFEAIAAADQVNAKVVASGISEALITTLSGLMIAIPAQAAYNFFVAQIDRFVIEMEEASTEVIDTLVSMEGH